MSFGLSKCDAYLELYIMVIDGYPLNLELYANGLFINSVERLSIRCKREISFEFNMKDLGLMHYLWGCS